MMDVEPTMMFGKYHDGKHSPVANLEDFGARSSIRYMKFSIILQNQKQKKPELPSSKKLASDSTIAPTIRQALLQWGYILTSADLILELNVQKKF